MLQRLQRERQGAAALTGTGLVAAGAIGGGLAGFYYYRELKGAVIAPLAGRRLRALAMRSRQVGRLAHLGRTGKVFAHGVTGGIRSVLSGGKFKEGFLSAGFTAFASPMISRVGAATGSNVLRSDSGWGCWCERHRNSQAESFGMGFTTG